MRPRAARRPATLAAAQPAAPPPPVAAPPPTHLTQPAPTLAPDARSCGCPANTVTGHGAGSSLLRTPERLQAIVGAMVAAVAGTGVPISVKLRSGFADTSLFEDNLLAVQVGAAAA